MDGESMVYLIEKPSIKNIREDTKKSEYSIKTGKRKIKLSLKTDKKIRNSWNQFKKDNPQIAKNKITFFLKKHSTKEDLVFPGKFQYVQTLSKTKEFQDEKFLKETNLLALSSLCLILTADNWLIFGEKKNMDNKLSGFSGYMNKKDVKGEFIDIYNYIIRTLKVELNPKKEHIKKIQKIGKIYSPHICDHKGKQNVRGFDNIFIIGLNMTKTDLKINFRKNFQFNKLVSIKNNPITLLKFFKKNYKNTSSHLLGALYFLFALEHHHYLSEYLRILPKGFIKKMGGEK